VLVSEDQYKATSQKITHPHIHSVLVYSYIIRGIRGKS